MNLIMSVGYAIIDTSQRKVITMAVYVANENGDWWGTNDKDTTLYVLDTDKLTYEEKVAIANEWEGFDEEEQTPEELEEIIEGLFGEDKFEKIIWEYGREQIVRI
jgi:hypothetical protein